MYPKSSVSPDKTAIDQDFYERLNQLAKARGPMKLSGTIPDAPKPTLKIGIVKQSPLLPPGSPAADLASSAPKLTSSPKISRLSDSATVGQDPFPLPDNQDPVSVVSVAPLALKASDSGRAGKGGRGASPSPRSQKAKDESGRLSPRISPVSSTTASPASSPRGSAVTRISAISVAKGISATSSSESSPSTTPRSESAKDKSTGTRKLQRKLTQKAEELAATLREVFKGDGRRSRAGSGERSSPKTPESPRVRFGSVDLVDIRVALDDPRFETFVRDAAQAAFEKPWEKDTSDVTDTDGNRKKNADKLMPTFIRDFDNSLYCCSDNEGQLVKLNSTDAFIEYVGKNQGSEFAKLVSNIASQNLGNFLKNALFLRQDAQEKSHSILTLSDGTPIMPIANARASYTFSRNAGGDLTIDYSWDSSAEVNGGKPMRVKTMDASPTTLQVSDAAKLKISVRVTVAPNGEWHIADPRVQASGWGEIEST